MILELDLASVREEPSGDEVVVVRVQSVFLYTKRKWRTPFLVGELSHELGILENHAVVHDSSARQARQATVDPIAGCAVEVTSFQIGRAKKIEEVALLSPANRLVGAHTPDGVVFKRRQDPRHERRGQFHVVIEQKSEFGRHTRQHSADLKTFVGVRYALDVDWDPRGRGIDRLLNRGAERIDRDYNQLFWALFKGRQDGFGQFVGILGNGWNDCRHVRRRILWIVRNWDGAIETIVDDQVDEQADIAEGARIGGLARVERGGA